MIRLSRLNGSEIYLNADLVATVEAHHDTVVTLVDGKTYVVRDGAEDVVAAITRYRATVIAIAERLADEQFAGSPDELPVAGTGAGLAGAGGAPLGTDTGDATVLVLHRGNGDVLEGC